MSLKIAINPDKRLTVVYPSYVKSHLLLSQFVCEPNVAYVLFNGVRVEADDLLKQINEMASDLRHTSYLVLDECDRATPSALDKVLTMLLADFEDLKVVVFSRRLPDFVHDASMQNILQFLPEESHISDELSANQTLHLKATAFGQGRLWVSGREVTEWNGHKARELFFFMIDNREVSRGAIQEAIWPDLETEISQDTFHTTKNILHNVLGFQLIEYTGTSYRLASNITLEYDVSELLDMIHHGMHLYNESMLMAVYKSYRNVYLAKMTSQWVEARRRELNSHYADCIRVLARMKVTKEEYDTALRMYLRVWAINQSYEDIAQRIMEICLLLNFPEKALEIYHGTRQQLLLHLGIQPDKSLRKLGHLAQKQSLHNHINRVSSTGTGV